MAHARTFGVTCSTHVNTNPKHRENGEPEGAPQ